MKKKNLTLLPKKPRRNYVILGVIYVVTILFVVYVCLWYQKYRQYQDTIPVLRGTIPEITEKELSHYVQENEQVVIYLCVPSNSKCRTFEKDLKTMITKKELKDNITYLNLENETHAQVMLDDLALTYQVREPIRTYPAFVLFENGSITKVLQGNTYADLSLSEVEQFLDTYLTVDE